MIKIIIIIVLVIIMVGLIMYPTKCRIGKLISFIIRKKGQNGCIEIDNKIFLYYHYYGDYGIKVKSDPTQEKYNVLVFDNKCGWKIHGCAQKFIIDMIEDEYDLLNQEKKLVNYDTQTKLKEVEETWCKNNGFQREV
jgi:serine/threonine protein phosphatase PrpC